MEEKNQNTFFFSFIFFINWEFIHYSNNNTYVGIINKFSFFFMREKERIYFIKKKASLWKKSFFK